MELVGVIQPPAPRLFLEKSSVVSVFADSVSDHALKGLRRIGGRDLGREADQIDVVFRSADRPDGGSERDGALEIDLGAG